MLIFNWKILVSLFAYGLVAHRSKLELKCMRTNVFLRCFKQSVQHVSYIFKLLTVM
jgi:hypothetical protein